MLKPWSQRVIPTNYWTAEEGKQLSQLHIPQGIFETMRGMPLSRVMSTKKVLDPGSPQPVAEEEIHLAQYFY